MKWCEQRVTKATYYFLTLLTGAFPCKCIHSCCETVLTTIIAHTGLGPQALTSCPHVLISCPQVL